MKGENRDGEQGREWRLLGLLYADDLVLYGKSEEFKYVLDKSGIDEVECPWKIHLLIFLFFCLRRVGK